MSGQFAPASSFIGRNPKILLVAFCLFLDGLPAVADETSASTLIAYQGSLETLKARDMEVTAQGVERVEWIKSGRLERVRHRNVRYLQSGSSRLVRATTATNDPSGLPFIDQLGCSRSTSNFLLKRNSDDAAFRLKYLGQNESAMQGLFDLYDLNIYRFSGYLFSYPIITLLQSPSFKVSGIDAGGSADGMTRFQVSFRDLENPEVVFQGWFVADSHHEWIIKGYEFQAGDGRNIKQTVKGTCDYQMTVDGLAIPKQSESIITIEGGSGSSIQKTTLEITDYQRTAPRESEFSLATYGLGSMETVAPSWTFFSAGSFITFSFACLLLAVIFRKWSNFKSMKG